MPHSSRKKRSPGRPPRDEAQQRHEALLSAALDEFLRHGFEGANVDAIARRAGVGRITVYRRFGGKEGLFRAAAIQGASDLESGLRELIAIQKPPRDMLREIILWIYDEFTAPHRLAIARLAIAEAGRFPDVCAAIWQVKIDEVVAPLTEFMQGLKRDKVFDIGDPADAAHHLINLACGGFRFLLSPPLHGARARRDWTVSVMRVIVPAFQETG